MLIFALGVCVGLSLLPLCAVALVAVARWRDLHAGYR